MKNNNFYIFVISTAFVFVICFFNLFMFQKQNTMTCERTGGDEVVFEFTSKGIKSMKINNKKVDDAEFLKYTVNFVSDFTWNSLSYKYSERDLIDAHMEDVKNYELNQYYSICE